MLAILTGSAPLGLAREGRPVPIPPLDYGVPSGPLVTVDIAGVTVLLLARHGQPHQLAPHQINYRANIELLARSGVQRVIALNTVGGIAADAYPGRLVVPEQLIDYTWGRAHTFVDVEPLRHADFEHPFDAGLRQALLAAGAACGLDLLATGVYGCTQGPRLETVAEIERMDRDGCTLVGMTGMPEAALARERGLAYAMLSLVVNPAAGRAHDPFNLERIAERMATGMAAVEQLLVAFTGQGGPRRSGQ
jgi:5'-methylthioinosine phosphorylase